MKNKKTKQRKRWTEESEDKYKKRQKSQSKRGGGAVCFASELAKVFLSAVSSVDQCGETSGSRGTQQEQRIK